MGSIHTEMTALLEDRSAPLYNRITDSIELTHLDIGSVLSILRDHADTSPEQLLFLWTLFEGVPKFYRDCFEQQVLAAPHLCYLPPQQNLWVRFGSGRLPRLCNRASFATCAVRKPYDFLVTSFTLLLSPSTAPAETWPRARNQFRIKGR